jgi:hypothetical protein
MPQCGTAPLFCLLLAPLLGSCSGGDAPKAWNELSTCLAGSASTGELVKRIDAVRRIQLNPDETEGGAAGWPTRCTPHANALHAAISGATEYVLLERLMRQKLNCTEGKSSCAFPTDSTMLSITTELWDAAKSAKFVTATAPNVKAPVPAPPPAIKASDWKSFSKEPLLVVGPAVGSDGTARVLLKATTGRGRPTICEFARAFDSVKCSAASAAMPEVPLHSVEWARAPAGLFVAAMAESGQVAYDLATGAQSDVRGLEGDLVQSGLAVGQSAEVEGKAKGFEAIVLNGGKANKGVELPMKDGSSRPKAVGSHVVWLEPAGQGSELVVKSVAAGRLKDIARLAGPFSGPFHTCAVGQSVALATWDRHEGQHGAKGRSGKTQLTITLLRGETWSPPQSVAMPSDRIVESELVCTASGASVAWAGRSGDTFEVSRADCTAEGCKTNSVKLPNVHTTWAWAVAPLGDKTLIAWRGSVGETRLRAAPLAALAEAKDTLVFDAPDFGGPDAADAGFTVGSDAVLVLFKGEKPVALRLGSDGTARVIL